MTHTTLFKNEIYLKIKGVKIKGVKALLHLAAPSSFLLVNF